MHVSVHNQTPQKVQITVNKSEITVCSLSKLRKQIAPTETLTNVNSIFIHESMYFIYMKVALQAIITEETQVSHDMVKV